MTHVPTKFHWDILKNEGILTTTTTTTITRDTVQGAQWIPFPSFRYGKKTGNNEKLRRKNGFYANLVM